MNNPDEVQTHPMTNLSQRDFESFLDHAAIGIVTIDGKGKIVLVNQFVLEMFGYEKEELLGQTIEVMIPRRFREKHVEHRKNYQQHNPHQRPMGVDMDLWAMRKDGSEFPVEVSLSAYETDAGKFSIAFISDISIRKANENAILKLNDELERKVATRTQSLQDALEREKELGTLKSRFVSMASHEFRTPLSTILSSAYLISKYKLTEDQPRRDKHIQRIISSVNMLTDILNDFLSVGRIEEGRIQVRPTLFNIVVWMQEVISELEQILKNGQKIHFSHFGEHELILDTSLLKHIVQNLVSNASKFSPADSVIQLETRLNDQSFSIAVKDSGIGISEADQKHLFERFYRGSNAVNIQGTGLGLHIVSKYAELLNGTISCESDLDTGTTFTVKIKLKKHI